MPLILTKYCFKQLGDAESQKGAGHMKKGGAHCQKGRGGGSLKCNMYGKCTYPVIKWVNSLELPLV